jgi:hypothetical protein
MQVTCQKKKYSTIPHEIFCCLWNTKVHLQTSYLSATGPMLNHTHPVSVFNIHFHITFSSTHMSHKMSQVFHLVFCTTHNLHHLSHRYHNHSHMIILKYEYMFEYQLWRFPLCEVLWFPFTFPLLHPNILIKNCSYPQSTFFILQCSRQASQPYTNQPANQPTNSMELSPSWEATRFSTSQVIPPLHPNFMEHGCSIWHLQQRATCPFPELSMYKNCKL